MSSVPTSSLLQEIIKGTAETWSSLNDSSVLFSWGGRQESIPQFVKSLHFGSVGEVTFPLSRKTIDDILPALSSTGFVRSDLVFGNLSKPSESFPLSKSLVGKMLKDSLENLNVGVHLQLHHLVAFDGASQKRELISLTEQPPPGTVGNFILQLPVEGGYSGGQLTISNTSGKEQVYDFSNQSDCFFHQLVITSPEPCKVEVEPIQRGTYIALIYNLLWADYFTLSEWYSPRCFGNFVKKAIAIRDCLNNWLPPSAANTFHHSTTEDIALACDERNANHSEIFCIPLLNVESQETRLKLSALGESDMFLLQVLTSINFLDVHLVNLEAATRKEERSVSIKDVEGNNVHETTFSITEVCWEISEWMESATGTPLPRERTRIDETQLLNISSRSLPNLKDIGDGKPRLMLAFAIQPRHRSLYSSCSKQFDQVLESFRLRVPPILQEELFSGGLFKRKQLLADVRRCLAFSMEHFATVWNNPSERAGGRACKLFDVCIRLRARKEGLMLLDIITRTFASFQTSESASTFVEGIRHVRVARKIAEFVEHLAGWKYCSPLILRMINMSTVTSQLADISFLATELVRMGCRRAATEMIDRLSNVFANLSADDIAKLTANHVDEYLNLVAAIYTNDETARYQTVFSKLEPLKRARLLLEWKKNLRQNGELTKFYGHLCNLIADSQLSPMESSQTLMELIEIYKRLDSECLTVSLVKSMCQSVNPTYSLSRYPLLEKLFDAQPDFKSIMSIFNFMAVCPTGQQAVTNYIDELIVYLKKEPAVSSSLDEEEQYQVRLFKCFCFVCIDQLSNEEHKNRRMDDFTSIFTKLTVHNLCKLILDTRELHPDENLTAKTLTRSLCSVFTSRNVSTLLTERTETLLEIITIGKVIGGPDLMFKFYSRLCSKEVASVRDVFRRNRLILSLLTDFNDELVPIKILISSLLSGIHLMSYLIEDTALQEELGNQISSYLKFWLQMETNNRGKEINSQSVEMFNCLKKNLSASTLRIVVSNFGNCFTEQANQNNFTCCQTFTSLLSELPGRQGVAACLQTLDKKELNVLLACFLLAGTEAGLKVFEEALDSLEESAVETVTDCPTNRRVAFSSRKSAEVFCKLLDVRIHRLVNKADNQSMMSQEVVDLTALKISLKSFRAEQSLPADPPPLKKVKFNEPLVIDLCDD